MTKINPETMYKSYFSEEEKAKAFDKIAEKYYYANFGSMSKADFETLLFSIYLERVLDKDETNLESYSDYTLSKILGISQSKVSSLKVKKELIYPYEKFNWIESFSRISDRAVYENEKIRLFIPDRNLYLEIKNAIETCGGFVEVQLNTNLLQVRVNYFLDLMVAVSKAEDRDKICKELKDKIKKQNQDISFLKKESFGKALQKQAPKFIIDLLSECIPVFGGPVQIIANNLYNAIISGNKES